MKNPNAEQEEQEINFYKEFDMKLNEMWDGLKRIANGDYVLEGDLISEETIEIDLDDRLVVRGRIATKQINHF